MNKLIAPILLTLVLTACGGGGRGSSSSPVTASTHNTVAASSALASRWIHAVTYGDLNNDGLEDVVLVSSENSTYYLDIMIQATDGSLSLQTNNLISNNIVDTDFKPFIGDFDNDGYADILVSSGSDGVPGHNVIYWGGTTFTRMVFTDLNIGTACVADFDNNGIPDILVGGGIRGVGDVGGFYLSNGDRTFTLHSPNINGASGNGYAFSSCAVIKNGTQSIIYFGLNSGYNPDNDRIVTIDNNLNFVSDLVVSRDTRYYTVDVIAIHNLDGNGRMDFLALSNLDNGPIDGVGPKIIFNNDGAGGFTQGISLFNTTSDFASRSLAIEGAPGVFISSNGYKNTALFKNTARYHDASLSTVFDDLGSVNFGQTAVYTNSHTGKIYVLQQVNRIAFYTQELK